MDMGFAIIRSLTRHRKPLIRFLFIGSHLLLRASFRPRLAASVISPLRFAITSRPSRCEEDFRLQAVDHARHTKKRERVEPAPVRKIGKFSEF
ncbi:MAG: hypothetical protein DMG50_05155 [Acidobacteria bacterium]|nr:MAG: hypothetical protein DMG50_05155 [Acidobacteriota bacterium]